MIVKQIYKAVTTVGTPLAKKERKYSFEFFM